MASLVAKRRATGRDQVGHHRHGPDTHHQVVETSGRDDRGSDNTGGRKVKP